MPGTASNTADNLEIVNRREINAPPGYVSVYHETTTEALEKINANGLMPFSETRNIGSSSDIEILNELFDRDRPERFAMLGVSRVRNVYAFYSLQAGFSLGFAARRYVHQSQDVLRRTYQVLVEHDSDALSAMHVRSFEEYERTVRDPLYLKQKYPGEVLEIKVDPSRAFVGDLALYTDVAYKVNIGGEQYSAGDAAGYWDSVITLNEFRAWYAQLQEVSDDRRPYVKRQDAPPQLPDQIASPEILISDAVPSAHIRVLA